MDQIFELSLGYVECDIDGAGYNTMYVNYDPWAPAATPFNFVRASRCYGDLNISNLSRDELVEIIESNRFLVSTRRARHSFNEFLRGLKAGKYDKGVNAVRVQRRGDITPAELPIGYMEPARPVDDLICNDICCNPNDSELEARPSVATFTFEPNWFTTNANYMYQVTNPSSGIIGVDIA